MLCTYLDQLDKTGHKFGPNSYQIENALRSIDKQLKAIVEKSQNNLKILTL